MNAAASLTSPISAEIGLIRELVSQSTSDEGLIIGPDRVPSLKRRLETIQQSVANLERQLAIHRINENDHAAAGILDDLICNFLEEEADKLDATTDNLIFPEFGQKGGK